MSDVAEIINKFGVDPRSIGMRHRGWWIVTEIDEEEECVGAGIGDLCIKARDGGYNEIDKKPYALKNFIGHQEDFFDRTYLYYYFREL